MSLDNKINKIEPFNLNRVINDVQSGYLRGFEAKPDFSSAHLPHVDLTVRPVGQDTIKYRIYDTSGASNLLQDFGPKGFGMP